jgi:3-oxoacyl-[acyl-carrier protein] reductase
LPIFSILRKLKKPLPAGSQGRIYHILINNTGGPPPGAILDADTEEFIRGFNAHLINNQQLVQHVVPGMKKEGYGRIINVISTSVKVPIPGLRCIQYHSGRRGQLGKNTVKLNWPHSE